MSNLGSQKCMSNIKRKKLRNVKCHKGKKQNCSNKPEKGQ